MPDEIDRAQAINEEHQAAALASYRRSRDEGESLEECRDCGESIPEKRRAAAPGCTRCIDCQRVSEMNGGR